MTTEITITGLILASWSGKGEDVGSMTAPGT